MDAFQIVVLRCTCISDVEPCRPLGRQSRGSIRCHETERTASGAT
jgi:hypothetical protein